MCYSARVQQHLRSLARRFGADVVWAAFEEIFERRLQDEGLKVARALERNFDAPVTDTEQRIHARIQAYRQTVATKWEADLFRQKKRLADAQRSLKEKETKKARDDQRIATRKIEDYVARLGTLRSTDALDEDDRIFPRY